MRNLLLFLPVLLLTSCITGEPPNFVGTYTGDRFLSHWEIELKKDSTFECQTEGHIGNAQLNGRIKVFGDTIILEPNNSPNIIKNMRFLLLNDTCLVELEYHIEDGNKYGWDYCKNGEQFRNSNLWNIETRTLREERDR